MPIDQSPMVISGERRRTHGEIAYHARRAAAGFARAGIRPGDAVAMLMRNDLAFFEVSMAAAMAGAYAVPINWQAKPDDIGYILRDCGARALVAHGDLAGLARAVMPEGVLGLAVETPAEVRAAYGLPAVARDVGWPDWDEWVRRFEPLEALAGAEHGAVIYTSGTTGRPKGVKRPPVPRTPGSARALKVYGLDGAAPMTVLINGPMYHSVPNAYGRLALRAGATIVLQPRFDAEEMLALVARHQVSHMHIVPAMFTRLLSLPAEVRARYNVSSLRYVAHGAAHCPPAVKAAMIGWFGPIIHEYYGSTETGLLTWHDSAAALRKPGTVGRALEGITLQILSPTGDVLPAGEIGDVYAGSATLHDFSYVGQADKRAEIARGDLVTAGDLGWLDEDGFLFLCDRKGDVIRAGGGDIYPARVEAALLGCAGVQDCAVLGVTDGAGRVVVCAFAEAAPGAALAAQDLRAALAVLLPARMVPDYIEIVDQLPREDSGKIFKGRLRERYAAGFGFEQR